MKDQLVMVPKKLQIQFKKDWKERQILVFSAFGGYGKTTLVKELLKQKTYCMRDVELDKDVMEPIPEGVQVMVIDQVHLLADREMQREIRRWIEAYPELHFVFITRGELPRWLIDYRLREKLVIYHSDMMQWDITEITLFLVKHGIQLSEKEIQEIDKVTLGYPITVAIFCYLYEEMPQEVSAILSQAVYKVCRYIEEEVFDEYSEKTQQILLTMAQFETFDIGLVRAVSGIEDVEKDIQELIELSSVVRVKSAYTYEFFPLFRAFLVWKTKHSYTKKEQNELQNRAAEYFELSGKTYQAIECYIRAGRYQKVQKMLEENGMRNPSIARYMEMEPFYRSLTYKRIIQSPSLISGMCMLESIRTNFDESEQWFQKLESYGNQLEIADTDYEEVRKALLFLQIALPHRSNQSIQQVFQQVGKLSPANQLDLPEFSITMGGISLINGGKDYSDWCKIDDYIYSTMAPVVQKVLGREGVGIVECGICESKFEKGESYQKHLVKMMEIYPEIKQKGCLDTEVAFHGILARISVAQGKVQHAKDTIYRILEQLPEEEKGRYAPNLEALLCRIALLTGDYNDILEWWQYKSPKETLDMWLLLRYQYRIKSEVMLQKTQYIESILLLTRILSYTEKCKWHIDEIQCHVLLAINYYRMKDKTWKVHLKKGVKLGAEFHLVYTIAQFGRAVLPLLKECPIGKYTDDEEYCKEVLDMAKSQSILYQKYLEPEVQSTAKLSGKEMQVLELICQNKTNIEISEVLGVKLTTVKSHVTNIFRKLGVKRRSERKTEAKRLRLVDDYLLL